jgi:D-serine deaminase-like pyridoxal phosphate-dependent protein
VIIAAGSPTFAIHAARNQTTELSPGTTVLWDYGYSQQYPDLNYLYAALVLTRVVSKPANNLLCLDLGHKAVASEMQHLRVKLIGLDDYQVVNHSEEHMVIKTPDAATVEIGTCFYGIPWHICPTVSRYSRAYAVSDGLVSAEWAVEARDWKINI